MSYRFSLVATLSLLVLLPSAARAADPASLWSGFYAGAHVGGLSGATNFSDPAGPALFGGNAPTPGFIGGVQLGYDWMVGPRWVAGLQADGSLASSLGSNTCLQHNSTTISSDCRVMPRAFATFTGRLGWVPTDGRLLLYGKGGLAWAGTDATITPNKGYTFLEPGAPVNQTIGAWGWTAGAGLEYAFTPGWSVGAEYSYLRVASSMPTPDTIDVNLEGDRTELAGNTSGLTFSQHMVKLALNWRPGMNQTRADSVLWAAQDHEAWQPDWEFDLGTRYWYSTGAFRNSNGSPGSAVSRLTYDHLDGHSGELYARLDSPYNVFLKLMAGGGFIAGGYMNDEDWAVNEAPPASYTNTVSSVTGSFNFLTADLGYNLSRGPNHKLGLFVGYNRTQVTLSAFGCAQVANPGAGVCEPPFDPSRNSISELDTWQSLRLGASAEVKLADRWKLSGDFAYLPVVKYDGLDIHHLRVPPVYFPVTGVGLGVQAELILSWQATESWSVGVGGRYWGWWTTNAQQTDTTNYFDVSMERYGVFLQASYKFGLPQRL